MARGGRKVKKGPPKKKKKELLKALKPIGIWVWAQCDNAGCQKWRKLPPGTVVNDKEPWFCYMNPNEDMNDCSIPEEAYNELTEAAIYSHPPPKPEASSNSEDKYDMEDSLTPERQPGKRKRSSAELEASTSDFQGKGEESFGGGGSSRRQKRPRSTNKQMDIYEDLNSSSPEEGGEGERGSRGGSQGFRGIVKARRAHIGLSKMLARGGVWEITKGKGKAVTAPPGWVWDSLATHSPSSAELACKAVDASSAARYFEIAQAPNGSKQASEAADNARLSLTVAAALAIKETSQIPGISASPQSGSPDTPASATFEGLSDQQLENASERPGPSQPEAANDWQSKELPGAVSQPGLWPTSTPITTQSTGISHAEPRAGQHGTVHVPLTSPSQQSTACTS